MGGNPLHCLGIPMAHKKLAHTKEQNKKVGNIKLASPGFELETFICDSKIVTIISINGLTSCFTKHKIVS